MHFTFLPLQWLILACCAVVSSLALVIYTRINHEVILLLFVISGYIITFGIILQTVMVLLRNSQVSTYTVAETFVSIPIYLFYAITGVWLIIYLIQGKIKFTVSPKHCEIIIPTLFIISIILIAISVTLHFICIFNYHNEPSEPNPPSSNHSYDLESQLSLNRQHTLFLEAPNRNSDSHSVIKKHSDQTLFDSESKKESNDNIPISKEFGDVNDEIDFIIENSMNIQKNPQEFSVYNEVNWMENTKLLSLAFPEELTPTTENFDTATRRNTYSSFGPVPKFSSDSLRRSYRKSMESFSTPKYPGPSSSMKHSPNFVPVKHSASTPVLWKAHSQFNLSGGSQNELTERTRERNTPFHSPSLLNLPDTHKSEDVEFSPTLPYKKSFVYPSINKPTESEKNASLSTIFTQGTLKQENFVSLIGSDDDVTTTVKRSKSTSNIIDEKKMKKREQRWKSIHDEKEFLLNVNESLLPSVLKSGESPIMKVKRQQQELIERGQRQKELLQNYSKSQPLSNGGTPTRGSKRFTELSPVGEDLQQSEILPQRQKYMGDDLLERNLPYINELDEPLDPNAFAGFDQDTAMVIEEDYSNTLKGLEKIPKTKKSWLLSKEAYQSRSMSMNHISLHEWNENCETWVDQRTRSGASLPGPRIVSADRGKFSHQPQESLLLPPQAAVEYRADNLDSLSDLSGPSSDNTRRPSYNALNRSFSAPSLHTFRNTSDSTKHSDENKDHFSCHDDCITPTETVPYASTTTNGPTTSTSNSTSTSPIRKMFHLESPKKLTSVFSSKRKSLVIANGHKHTESMASNQISLSSAVSSKSSSPRKSFKTFVSRVNHRAHLSVPEKPNFMAQSPTSDYYRFSADFDMVDLQDIEPAPSSDRSRVSSVPSAVIGEYDREKWRTLKLLQSEDQIAYHAEDIRT